MLMLLSMGWISFLCGCASNTIIMTPSVKASDIPAANNTLYRVTKVTAPIAHGSMSQKLKDKKFSEQFAGIAEARYPGLFANTPEAIPLHVQLEISEEVHEELALLSYLCTCCVLGGILPSVPWTTEWQIKVGIEDRSGIRNLADVRAVHRGWWSLFSPCGLITFPGESDIPAVSTVMTGGPGQVPEKLQEYVLQSMVDLLANKLLSGSPLQSPGKVELLAPQQLPALIPIPSETVNPF
jgi:hypothetical protein